MTDFAPKDLKPAVDQWEQKAHALLVTVDQFYASQFLSDIRPDDLAHMTHTRLTQRLRVLEQAIEHFREQAAGTNEV